MPNYFQFLGPNSPIGNGPVLIAIEAQADYMLSLCDRWQTENIHSLSPKDEAVTGFLEHCEAFMQDTVWIQECRSWYKSGSATGRVSALWPGSTLHYLEALKEVRADDWDVSVDFAYLHVGRLSDASPKIKYKGNRFSWLGSGISQTELDPFADLGYYISSRDDSPFPSRRGRREMLTHTGFNARALSSATSATAEAEGGLETLSQTPEHSQMGKIPERSHL